MVGQFKKAYLPRPVKILHFLGIGSLVFSETQHGVRGPCLVACDRAGFFLKKSFCPKNGENGPRTGFFEFIGKFSH